MQKIAWGDYQDMDQEKERRRKVAPWNRLLYVKTGNSKKETARKQSCEVPVTAVFGYLFNATGNALIVK